MITVEEAIKKNLLHKGKKSHFIYMKEKQALYVWISQPCRVVNRDPNKIRVKQFNKLHHKQNKKVPMWTPTAAVSKQRKVDCNQQELGAL